MEIILSSIGDKGDIKNERIGIKVLKDCDLKYYLVFKTVLDTKGFHNKSKSTYWFLSQEVKIGDKIVLYTRVGETSIKDNSDGSKTYFFYWGLDAAVFKESNDKVVLASLKSWKVIP